MIKIEDFKQTEIRIGKILSAEKVEGLDKILKLNVDLGEETPRQILSGIAQSFEDPQVLVGVLCPFVVNLEPKVIKNLESHGMILACKDKDGIILLQPSRDCAPGELVG